MSWEKILFTVAALAAVVSLWIGTVNKTQIRAACIQVCVPKPTEWVHYVTIPDKPDCVDACVEQLGKAWKGVDNEKERHPAWPH